MATSLCFFLQRSQFDRVSLQIMITLPFTPGTIVSRFASTLRLQAFRTITILLTIHILSTPTGLGYWTSYQKLMVVWIGSRANENNFSAGITANDHKRNWHMFAISQRASQSYIQGSFAGPRLCWSTIAGFLEEWLQRKVSFMVSCTYNRHVILLFFCKFRKAYFILTRFSSRAEFLFLSQILETRAFFVSLHVNTS